MLNRLPPVLATVLLGTCLLGAGCNNKGKVEVPTKKLEAFKESDVQPMSGKGFMKDMPPPASPVK